jgi:hypothetical protein
VFFFIFISFAQDWFMYYSHGYGDTMTITQTVEIPANRRLTIDVPSEVPVGRTILAFTPASEEPCPLCAIYHEPNEETIAAFEEGDAMLRGEKPAHWHRSLDDLDKMLGL